MKYEEIRFGDIVTARQKHLVPFTATVLCLADTRYANCVKIGELKDKTHDGWFHADNLTLVRRKTKKVIIIQER